jgi:putative molybdopterin biosynthesis protein
MTAMHLLTVQEAAELLRVKASWVYKMARSGELPSVRLGRQVRIDEEALQRWLLERSKGGDRALPDAQE